MPFEYNIESTLPEKKSLDDAWYGHFQEIAAFQDYEYLNGDKKFREEQKEKFLLGEVENPQLDYPALETFDFSGKEIALLNLKKNILESESNEVVLQLYRWRINEKLAELRMLRASKNGDDKKFLRYSKFIYGQPEKEIYTYTISQIKKVINTKLFHTNPEISASAARLNAKLFETLMDNETSIDPKSFNLPQKKSLRQEEEFPAEAIKKAFEESLVNYDILGWNVVIDTTSNTAINVNQEKKEIFIPQNRLLKKTNLKALIEHEIGTHVLRREKGETSKLKLLGLGLDRYVRGEEGVATFKQQAVEGASEFAGLDMHFTIALALGVDGKKRNFRQVFEILQDFYFLKNNAIESAKKSAWNMCIRAFRGTSCKTPGACFTKDIVYREGNIGIWSLSKEGSPELGRISVGKYDPLNPRHIWILNQLNITESDLEALDKEA